MQFSMVLRLIQSSRSVEWIYPVIGLCSTKTKERKEKLHEDLPDDAHPLMILTATSDQRYPLVAKLSSDDCVL